MRNLLNFLLKYSAWILFIVYATASCVLLFQYNPYQHHVWLTSANVVSAGIYGTASNVTSYFALRDINDDLQRRNTNLELEVLSLRKQVRQYQEQLQADTVTMDSSLARYSFILAHVINNSVNRPHNYITLEKGENDGVRPEMGVVDQNGVVGIVNVVGPHASRVISLLNPNLRLSCKVKGQDYVGSLVWDGQSPSEAVLEELPRHGRFHKGDTIVTSGFSTVFPEGVPVGTVIGSDKNHDENFFSLRVKLFTDFSTLSTVRVVSDAMKQELAQVESE